MAECFEREMKWLKFGEKVQKIVHSTILKLAF